MAHPQAHGGVRSVLTAVALAGAAAEGFASCGGGEEAVDQRTAFADEPR
jgi:hypothetical protein